ncbi:hypothetical protein ACHAWF_003185 [Thalassiosira exigua]
MVEARSWRSCSAETPTRRSETTTDDEEDEAPAAADDEEEGARGYRRYLRSESDRRTDALIRVLRSLRTAPVDVELLASTGIGKAVGKVVKLTKKREKETRTRARTMRAKKANDGGADGEEEAKESTTDGPAAGRRSPGLRIARPAGRPSSRRPWNSSSGCCKIGKTRRPPRTTTRTILPRPLQRRGARPNAERPRPPPQRPNPSPRAGRIPSSRSSDIDATWSCCAGAPDWRSLYRALELREGETRRSHGDRVRGIREKVGGGSTEDREGRAEAGRGEGAGGQRRRRRSRGGFGEGERRRSGRPSRGAEGGNLEQVPGAQGAAAAAEALRGSVELLRRRETVPDQKGDPHGPGAVGSILGARVLVRAVRRRGVFRGVRGPSRRGRERGTTAAGAGPRADEGREEDDAPGRAVAVLGWSSKDRGGVLVAPAEESEAAGGSCYATEASGERRLNAAEANR